MIDIEKALFHPQSIFKKPQDVLSCNELTRKQKIEILHHWEEDARELEVAEEENMAALENEDILHEILWALRSLNAPLDLEHRPPTKQGGDPTKNN